MNIIVSLKPVPDPKEWNKLQLDPRTKTLVRTGIGTVINPLDKNALEAAIRLKEELGGEVAVLSMAPPEAKGVLREALAMGADKAVLLSDRAFAGSDTLGTAHVLAQGVKSLGIPDLILCGDESIDGGTAQVSAQLAEFLGLPNLMHVSRIQVEEGGVLTLHSRVEHGYHVIEARPPLVLSVTKELNEPRYTTLMNVLEAESKPLMVWTSEQACPEEACVGLADSPTQMADLFRPQAAGHAEMLEGSVEEQAQKLADRLRRLGFC